MSKTKQVDVSISSDTEEVVFNARVFDPIWGVRVELVNPVRYSDRYAQGYCRVNVNSPADVKFDGLKLTIQSMPDGTWHNIPANNIVKWDVYYIDVPDASIDDTRVVSFRPFPQAFEIDPVPYVGQYLDANDLCVAFLCEGGRVTYVK